MEELISASYIVESPLAPEDAAAALAGESSTGTFVKIPGERPEIVERYGARVESIREIGSVDRPSLPEARPSGAGPYRQSEVTLSWPLHNMGPSLPNILATVAGNLFEVKEVTGLRLTDLHLPRALNAVYPGPQFGIAGTRAAVGVDELPLIGTIIKPSIGLTPSETADLVSRLADGGIDFIKDDELMADPPHSPFADRVKAVTEVLDRHAQRTGRKVLYAFNVTGESDEMLRRHDLVAAHGGNCIMVSLNWIGPVALAQLRRHARLPIHGHRNGWGILTRHPALGFDFRAWHKIYRLAGADHIHVNGIRNKFFEADESVGRSARACHEPLFADGGPALPVMPVFSSGQTALQAADTFRTLGSTDLIFAAGGGIMAHPDGIAAGVSSIRDAWTAAMEGIPLDAYAAERPELQRAIEKFSR